MGDTFRLPEARALLARTPAALAALLADLPDAWTEAREGPTGWSSREIVAHLVHGEDTDWVPRARLIRASGEAEPFVPFDREGHRAYVAPLATLLREFASKRAANLVALDAMALGEGDLDRPGRHPALGRVTLRELLATWVAHDLNHLRQIARVMAKRYAAEVGPWIAYLPVLRETGGAST
jgi:hypothetical protein